VLVKEAGHNLQIVPVHDHPDEAGLLGAVHLAPAWMLDGHDAILAVDIGGSNLRAGLVQLRAGKAEKVERSDKAGKKPGEKTEEAGKKTGDKTGDKASAAEIWHRFPKFIIGFVLTFLIGLFFALGTSAATLQKVTPLIGEANNFRVIFFVLTFFSIGVLSNFRKLWQEGFGKLALVYFVSLFGFVIWVGLLISWLFFSGVKPPLAS